MNSITLLVGLLVLAYAGGQLVGSAGSYRLPSGTEYLLLGVAVGPLILGLVERTTLQAFEPLASVGAAWLTLVIGAQYGKRRGRRVSFRGLALGVGLALMTAAAIFSCAYVAVPRFLALERDERFAFAAALAIASCETTGHAVRWVVGRYGVRGPLSRLVSELSEADDLVPMLGMALLLPWMGHTVSSLAIPVVGWAVITVVFGGLLGMAAAALLRGEPRASDGWGVVIGATLVGVGIALRLGLSAQVTSFALGLSLSALSRHRHGLRAMLLSSEEAVLLPLLLLAGALVRAPRPIVLGIVTAAIFVVRLLMRGLVVPLCIRLSGAPPKARGPLALGLTPSGALSIAVSFELSRRFSGEAADLILSTSVASVGLGELLGPPALRRAFMVADEVAQAAPERAVLGSSPDSSSMESRP